MQRMNDYWSICDFWRSYTEALALKNGHCPDIAVANHREWCVRMGFETPDGGERSLETQQQG